MRIKDGYQTYVLDYHPFDVVGWDGYVYPWTFNINDFEPITGRIHMPPPSHQTFQGRNFVICSFCPRKLDFDPLAIPIPYHHSNLNSEEMIYYVSGNFGSRKGIEIGSVTLHPSGIPHGPHPGLAEKSIGMTETHELAVMCDTFHPLRLTPLALELDDPAYAYSWYEAPEASGEADERRRGSGGSDLALLSRVLVVDFDGTITEDDLLDEVAQTFGDPEVYREVDEGLDENRLTLREVIRREFEPVRAPLDEVTQWVLGNVRIRPGFRELVELARERGWRFVIVSSGFHELIEPILEREGVEVELHANRVDPDPSGWRVLWQYEDDCEACGESCKRSVVKEFARDDEIVYIGDGYSDRCAAEASDRVFALRELARYLDERSIPYEPFDDFHQIAGSLDGGSSPSSR